MPAPKKTLTEAEAKAKADERKAKFKELGGKRLGNAMKAIGLIGNLAAYKPSEAQVAFVIGELETAVKGVKARLAGGAKVTTGIEIPD